MHCSISEEAKGPSLLKSSWAEPEPEPGWVPGASIVLPSWALMKAEPRDPVWRHFFSLTRSFFLSLFITSLHETGGGASPLVASCHPVPSQSGSGMCMYTRCVLQGPGWEPGPSLPGPALQSVALWPRHRLASEVISLNERAINECLEIKEWLIWAQQEKWVFSLEWH